MPTRYGPFRVQRGRGVYVKGIGYANKNALISYDNPVSDRTNWQGRFYRKDHGYGMTLAGSIEHLQIPCIASVRAFSIAVLR